MACEEDGQSNTRFWPAPGASVSELDARIEMRPAVFLSQRAKAQDSAAKADVSTIGKELATYYVDNTTVPAVTQVAGRYLIAGVDVGKSSTNVVLGAEVIASATSWCVFVTNPEGDKSKSPGGYKYSAAGGLEAGVCA